MCCTGTQEFESLTCMSECKTYVFKPHCSPSYVIKSNGKWVKQCENGQVPITMQALLEQTNEITQAIV